MKLQTGYFSLFQVFEFALGNPEMPSFKNKELQSQYSKLISNTIASVPSLPGWYLWGKFNDMGWWETVYLGKAGKAKTFSLHTRMYDELREECIAFWAEVYGREPIIKQDRKLYDDKHRDSTRSLRKSGSRIVLWIAVEDPISEAEIKRQEDFLIKLYRPTHNAARWNASAEHDYLTREIEQAIEDELQTLMRASRSV
ncbi:MAG TPA: hypothetical protein VLH84_03420 [Patescibacteria group bacterium]|nr:hypothetical protein [Patescibacteria group bacterium]